MDTGRSGRIVRWRHLAKVCGMLVPLVVCLFLPARPGLAVQAAENAAAPPPCHAADLDAAVSHGGVTDHLWLAVALTTIDPATTCALDAGIAVQVWDADGRLLIAAPIPAAG